MGYQKSVLSNKRRSLKDFKTNNSLKKAINFKSKMAARYEPEMSTNEAMETENPYELLE